MRRILEDLQPRGPDIDILSEDEGYIIWTHWIDPNTENLRSGTIRLYLGSYQAFLDFVTMERMWKGMVPEVEADVLRIFGEVMKRVKGWRKTVDLETRPQQTQRLLHKCFKGLKNDDVDTFLQSKPILDFKEAITPPLRCAKRETT